MSGRGFWWGFGQVVFSMEAPMLTLLGVALGLAARDQDRLLVVLIAVVMVREAVRLGLKMRAVLEEGR